MARPELVDNRGANTHAHALHALADDHDSRHPLAAATAYFNLIGLHHLAQATRDGRSGRLLLGTSRPTGGKSSTLDVFGACMEEFRRDRDHASFPPSRASKTLSDVLAWLQRDDIEVRRYLKQFLHGKAYLLGEIADARAALVTSANLTAAGLARNLELGVADYQPHVARSAIEWFDRLWEEAPDFKGDLIEILGSARLNLEDPWTVFLRALLELFGDDEEEIAKPGKVNLAPFQWDGYRRALKILRRHHGVVFADGVGTGKTMIGLAFLEEYALRRGQLAIVIAPAQLRERWQDDIAQRGLPAKVLSYHELASDIQLAPKDVANRKRHLSADKDAYRLVLADEGHAFRNPGTTWHRALSRLLGGEPKDLVLLTATPINNGLWDLYHLVMAFARHDRAFANWRIPSLRELFERAGASARKAADLDPDVLFALADLVSVRRDRRFLVERYKGETFPDGTVVRFPEPELHTARYDLDSADPGLVPTITEAIEGLTMARYVPSRYLVAGNESKREGQLSGLLRSGILKRFESCWHACRLTVKRMMRAHEAFLVAWDEGWVLGGQALKEAAEGEEEVSGLAETLAEDSFGDDRIPSSEFDPSYRKDVERDLAALRKIEARLDRLTPEDDPKLACLTDLIEKSPSQKVIVFSTFADTIRYLDEQLPEKIRGRERITVIGDEADPDQRTEMLSRFAPKSVIGPDHLPEDGEVDLLLSNDVLSEGQNLQQAAAVISYDMPWNPQRVVQRYGRVIRLKSEHRRVFLTTMLPAPGELEPILKLEVAIRRKMAAAGVYGMEVEVVEDAPASEVRAFADRLQAGDASLLDEAADGDEGQLFSGEGLRAELARWIHEMGIEKLKKLPWGTGAVFQRQSDDPRREEGGWFFACRTRRDERYWRWVERDRSTRPEPDAAILRRIHPRGAEGLMDGDYQPDEALEAAWSAAAASIVSEHNGLVEAAEDGDSIGPLQTWAIRDILEDPDVRLPDGANAAAEALAVGRGTIVRRALGAIRKRVESREITRDRAAIEIVELVRTEGLRPVEELARLEPITEEDLGVVCWMEIRPTDPT